MKLKEWYNNLLLSIIASCLLVILVDKDKRDHADGLTPIPATRLALIPVNEDGSINVKIISSDIIAVNIENIDTRDVLNFNLKELGGGYIKYNGPINVKLDN